MTSTTNFPLFDVPGITINDDRPRTRKTDPITSHIAADASAAGLKDAKHNVLYILSHTGPITGSELNAAYQAYARAENWRRLAYDSPRKRAGELVADGYLTVASIHIADGNNLPESVYALTPKGEEAIR